MAITYPLTAPLSTIGLESLELIARNAVARTESPFTFRQDVVAHTGQAWAANVSVPPQQRDLLNAWIAFLVSLKGSTGTFLMGDPLNATPRGSASTTPGTPVVFGGGQTGDELLIDGLPASATGYLLAGDYIQLGAASTTRLYQVLQDVNSNGSGEATVDIWPNILTAPADNATVTVSGCQHLWRLAGPVSSWQMQNANITGLQFAAAGVVP